MQRATSTKALPSHWMASFRMSAKRFFNLDQQDRIAMCALSIKQMQQSVSTSQPVHSYARPREQNILTNDVILNLESAGAVSERAWWYL